MANRMHLTMPSASLFCKGEIMYRVHYWANCPITGRYLAHMIFDTMRAARKFARLHDSRVELCRGF